jgi:zinc transport system ATP-binding protein
MIKVNKVNFIVDHQVILKDINFSIKKGEYVALVGSNGAGKSTIIKAILGLKTMTSGSIVVDPTAKIGYLSQILTSQIKSFPATVYEVVESGFVRNKKMSLSQQKKEIIKMLTLFKLEEFKDKKIGLLSGGQQQRTLIARMLVSRPDMLILDEPTSSLDPTMRDYFYHLLKELHEDGLTIILVTHDVASIGEMVNRIIYLDQKVLFDGTFKQFCETKELTPFIHTHKAGHHHDHQ